MVTRVLRVPGPEYFALRHGHGARDVGGDVSGAVGGDVGGDGNGDEERNGKKARAKARTKACYRCRRVRQD